MATKQIKIKVSKNLYGNYRGFLTGSDVSFIGDFDFDALEWTSEALKAHPSATLNDKSYFTMAEIIEHREGIAKVRLYK